MAKIIEMSHKGITVKIRELTSIKNGTAYTEFQVVDYSTGKRVRHSRATLEEAKTKAKQIAEAIVTGERELLEWDDRQRKEIRQELKLMEGTKMTVDRACSVFCDALRA